MSPPRPCPELQRIALLLVLAVMLACATRAGAPPDVQAPGTGTASTVAGTGSAGAAPAAADRRVFALLLNGGSRREINYRSHLVHVTEMLALLRAHGVPDARIAVFSGDGADPAADLAIREKTEGESSPGEWILPTTGADRWLRTPITYVNSEIDGVVLRPAKKDGLRAWFTEEGARLGDGDTLLFYVTDHGEKNEADITNNTISLWGEKLDVAELRGLFALLDPQVAVVMLMSQCFAGAFANAIAGAPAAATGTPAAAPVTPAGNVCGFFASTADRPAYGCYPENRGKEGIGHSHNFVEALAELDRFSEAQRRVLVTDRTPDVPHATVDFYLDQLLHHAAKASGRDFAELVDGLLATAWRNRAAWEPEIRLLDRIGRTFGSYSPRSLAELEEQARTLPEFSQRLGTYAERWRQALESLKVENMRGFVEQHPEWRARLEPKQLEALTPEQRGATARELIAGLLPFAENDAERYARLIALRKKAEEAAAASYRAEVRLGVVLRMRALLTSIAGRVYVADQAAAEERAAVDRLASCEALALGNEARVASAAELEPPAPFPPIAEEQRLVESLMPAYMGIHFRPLSETQRQRYKMERGAVTVMHVNPDSPADTAGLRLGDIVLGPPGHPFTEPEQVREWTMWREIGEPAPLEVSRAGQPLRITLRPDPYPLAMPDLPGPPKVGSVAPALKMELFRGTTELAQTKPRLLFFWATWCVICKHAVPEMLAFARERDVELVAITDEDPETLAPFFLDMQEPFPEVVAIDPLRISFRNYGVSGTPTFVLIDGKGVVRHYQSGYTLERGLQIEGWKAVASRKPAAPAAPASPGAPGVPAVPATQ